MDLRFTDDEIAFRDELRAFIRDNLPGDIRERMRLGYAPRKEDTVRWQRILNARGWAAFNWPKEYGGPGWTPVERMIFLEENQLAPAPEVSSFNITMIGPVLIQFGSEAQKAALSAARRQYRRLVVPGLLRAGRRLRPRLLKDRGAARERPLGGQRAEDLDLDRAPRRLVLLPGAHRFRRRRSGRRASRSC